MVSAKAATTVATEIRIEEQAMDEDLYNKLQIMGHELAEEKANNRRLIITYIKPMIRDAIDALEIFPPSPDIAISRLSSILRKLGN